MNRFVKFAAATLLVASATFAQEGALKVGAYVGAGLAGFNGDDADDIDAGFGFAVGGAAEYSLFPKIAIAPNVLFSMRMPSYEIPGDAEDPAQTIDVSEMSLDIPVLIKYKVDKIHVLVGPQIGINLSSEMSSGSVTIDTPDRKSLEFGATGGLGYQVNDKLSVDLRYYFAFTNQMDDQTVELEDVNGDVIGTSSVEVNRTPYYAMLGATYMF
jgi:opacity protein-like surface antigen